MSRNFTDLTKVGWVIILVLDRNAHERFDPMAMALLVTADGKTSYRDFESLRDYQAGVDGNIELVRSPNGSHPDLFVNDEFLYRPDLDINIFASVMVAGGTEALLSGQSQPIHGDVVVIGSTDEEGETLDLDVTVAQQMVNLVEQITQHL